MLPQVSNDITIELQYVKAGSPSSASIYVSNRGLYLSAQGIKRTRKEKKRKRKVQKSAQVSLVLPTAPRLPLLSRRQEPQVSRACLTENMNSGLEEQTGGSHSHQSPEGHPPVDKPGLPGLVAPILRVFRLLRPFRVPTPGRLGPAHQGPALGRRAAGRRATGGGAPRPAASRRRRLGRNLLRSPRGES